MIHGCLCVCWEEGKKGDLIEGNNNVNGVWDVLLGWVIMCFGFLIFCLWVSLLFSMFPSGF